VAFSPSSILDFLLRFPPARRYRVALSGGLDSSVLLHALALERGALPGELSAVHINHGLHPKAADWQAACERACAALGVPIESHRVNVDVAKGESLEATARERRYGAFRELMRPGDALLLAHHADDQAETFLLQALRGAGVRGLSAMPESAEFARGLLLRPLLAYPRTELEAWTRSHGLTWIEDPSNTDRNFDRNYLRHEVMPLLKSRWPATADTLSRAARHSAEAEAQLQALAAEDWQRYGAGETLPVRALEELQEPRARQLLRYWVHRRGLPLPPAHKLSEILLQSAAAEDRNPCVDWDGSELRRYGGQWYALEPLPPAPQEFQLRPGVSADLGPGLGALRLVPALGEGVRAALCGPTGLRVSFRGGGESCRPAGRAHGRPLKKWLQEMHVFPWLRDRLPLIYSGEGGAGGELLAVAGLFACEPHAAQSGEAGLRIEWREHPPLH
jgi:tRNA(Ile)-lysidine synthase